MQQLNINLVIPISEDQVLISKVEDEVNNGGIKKEANALIKQTPPIS